MSILKLGVSTPSNDLNMSMAEGLLKESKTETSAQVLYDLASEITASIMDISMDMSESGKEPIGAVTLPASYHVLPYLQECLRDVDIELIIS